jgi:DNA-directed RNA polymerase beta' subunit
VPLYKVDGLTLSVFSKEDVTMLSVTSCEEEQIFKEGSNGVPVTHGINDDLMGTMDKDRLCKTCSGSQTDCPGHFGHIKLERPVFHGNMLEYIRKVLRMVCCKCSHLLSIDLQASEHAPIHDDFAFT